MQPTVAERLRGFPRLIVVAHEDVRAAQEDLAFRRDLELRAGSDHTHGTKLDAIGHTGGQPAILGLPVDLAHVDTQRAVPLYELGRDWRSAGAGVADAVHTDGTLDVVKDQEVGDRVHERQDSRWLARLEPTLGDLEADAKRPG